MDRDPTPIAVSIVIVSYNTQDHLRRCLLSLSDSPPSATHEVIVVDNASTDGSGEMVSKDFTGVRLIVRDANDGYGVAVNCGVQHASGQMLIFLNPDTQVSAGALDELIGFVQSHPAAAVVGPKLLLPEGGVQASAKRFCSAWLLLLEASRVHRLLPSAVRGRVLLGTYFDQNSTLKVPWVSGACHAIPRQAWDEIGPLTERTFCGFDDYDYCYRAWRKGYEVWLDSSAVVVHGCGVAVYRRWHRAQVEKIAIHNTYVVLSDHWPKWKVKAYQIAELTAYCSDWLKMTVLGSRRSAPDETDRLRLRMALLWRLITGRERPVSRYQG